MKLSQNIGRNTLGAYCMKIAEFLGYENFKEF